MSGVILKYSDRIADEDLRQLIQVEKETRSGQYIAACPFCKKSAHFYINKVTQRWDCKRCGESGNIVKLLRHFDKLYLLGAATVKASDEIKSIRTISAEAQSALSEIKLLPEISMPAGFRTYKKLTPYLEQRRITMADVEHYKFGCTRIVSRYLGYVLIPIIDNGKVRGFIGRYGNKSVPADKLRYSNSLNTDFSELLFGYDDIVDGKTEAVIITEGLFDAIAVTKHLDLMSDEAVRAVCTFGKKISDIQIRKLLQKGVRRIILLYDFDAIKEIKKYAAILNEHFEVGVAVAMNKKDIDECTREEALEVFANIRSVQEFNFDVVGKIKR